MCEQAALGASAGPHASDEKAVVLIVDDDTHVLALLISLLASEFNVIAADNGRDALKIATSSEQQLDVVLTDVCMPVMNGAQLGRNLAGVRPQLPRIYMSGSHGGIALEAGAILLPKPFDLDTLASVLRMAAKDPDAYS